MVEVILIIICLPLIYLGIGYFFAGLGYLSDFFMKKNEFGCATIAIILMVLFTILGGINMIKSCADNDREPSYDYYDAPRK